jgi:hypothetical protein
MWFAKIERDVIARGGFTSVTDLRCKLLRYRAYSKRARPFRRPIRIPNAASIATKRIAGTNG